MAQRFAEYNNYTSQLDAKTLESFQLYAVINKGIKDFQTLRISFENFIMSAKADTLAKITADQRLYRDYRAYMREHHNRLGKPWPVAFNGFMEEYFKPERQLYRDFVVTGEDALERVKEFYEWLDSYHPKGNLSDQKPDRSVPLKDLEKEAAKLYRQKEMWNKIQTGLDCGSNKLRAWNQELKKRLVTIIGIYLDDLKLMHGKDNKRDYTVYELFRVLVRFHKCFHTEGFYFGNNDYSSQKFFITTIRKALEFMSEEGIPEVMYFLATVRPDLVTDDCYPWVNVSKDLYGKTDYERLLTIKPFRKVSWCQKYWDVKYHTGF